jgi:AraC family transcriptional regulator
MISASEEALIRIKPNDDSKNIIVYSALKEFYHPIKSNGFDIKYVMEGVEKYTLNGQNYTLGAGQYLLSNATHEGHIEVESKTPVTGVCINIEPAVLSEVIASHRIPDTPFSDKSLGQFFHTDQFLEQIYASKSTNLGEILRGVSLTLKNNLEDKITLDKAFFYTLSEKIIADQIPVFKQLQKIPSLKSSTKKDLFRRISKGKDFIDNSFSSPLTIEAVAKAACMSEYHFSRLFKASFGLSPHQYILKKRLEYGFSILLQDKYAVSNAAFESGFSDIYSFSKAFKKYFGCAPSVLLKN